MSHSNGAQCSVCGRRLTSAASIAAGVGPVCAQTGGKKRKHRLPRLRKLSMVSGAASSWDSGVVAPVDRPMPIQEVLTAVRRIAEKSPNWEVIG